ncbi:peptidylprolyl isomerase [Saccharothrix deserti]|uniref:peptidylprolyl isomerase n=1 Tax=Saccharothrix deserti TaxID=2593674 RepID=UPI00131C5117|nr:peptidylprolyl isomerase [Saccharothrix deserti]
MARRLLVSALILLTTACTTAVPGRPVAGSAPTAGTTPTAPIPTVDCEYPRAEDEPPREMGPPDAGAVPAEGTVTIRFDTGQGRIDVELDAASAPCAVHSFRHLVKKQFYPSTACHRLTVEGLWVLQCGDPTGTGTGGPGYAYDDPTAKAGDYKRGVVAMANAGPGTNGSQFFIVYQDSPVIGPDFPVLGRVTLGMEVVDKVVAGGVVPGTELAGGDGKPATPLVFLVVEPA